jgi:hypothetical protein
VLTIVAPAPASDWTVSVLALPGPEMTRTIPDERIIAKHYVFSGNGEHGNPERESLEMLFKAHGDADYAIHPTYPIDEIDKRREEDLK